jgi:hypothetical protein
VDYVLGAVLIAGVYALVYYRLLVRHFLEKDEGCRESQFAALLSPPPFKITSPRARKYAKRYYVALAVLLLCFAVVAWRADFKALTAAG